MTKEEKKLISVLKNKNFAPKYHKNIIIDICHAQSWHAKSSFCYICKKGVSKKESAKMKGRCYGYQFGSFYNKRHQQKDQDGCICPKFFLKDICRECVGKIEKMLDFSFVKSYAP